MIANKLYIHPDEVDIIESKACWCVEVSNKPINKGLLTYINAASLWHDLKEDKPPLRKWVMFRYSGGGVNPTALHYGAMSDDVWVVTRGDGTQRIEVLYECNDKIEWLDFDELK